MEKGSIIERIFNGIKLFAECGEEQFCTEVQAFSDEYERGQITDLESLADYIECEIYEMVENAK